MFLTLFKMLLWKCEITEDRKSVILLTYFSCRNVERNGIQIQEMNMTESKETSNGRPIPNTASF